MLTSNQSNLLTDEEEFSYKQAKLRSKIRLKEKRAKPIDLILYSLSFIEKKEKFSLTEETTKEFSIYEKEIYKILLGLKLEELEEMKEDIILYSTYDQYSDFWKALLKLCEYQMKVLNQKIDKSFIQKEILEEILGDMNQMNYKELIDLENDVKYNLENNDVGLDMEFWDIILQEIELSKSKALLNDYHQKIQEAYKRDNTVIKKEPIESQLDKTTNNSLITENSLNEKEMLQRVTSYEETGDFYFADEIPISSLYSWEKDIEPIKPKYSNRVCYGTDYEKLKQYYDSDLPPEKYITGYKFHIFYPDLIDVREPPTFFLDNESEDVEKCTIRFMGSAPYTDLAFEVQNRVWERSYKKGFLATFDKGMLVLHFGFKKKDYRR
eukprot:gene12114-5606_t